MIEETGVLVERNGEFAWVETLRQSACGSCSQNKGCGVSVLQRLFSARKHRIKVVNPLRADIGDRVVLGLDEDAFIRGSFLTYLMPLLSSMGLAFVGEILARNIGASPNALSMLGAAIGLLGGYLVLHLWTQRKQADSRYHPIILRRIADNTIITPTTRLPT